MDISSTGQAPFTIAYWCVLVAALLPLVCAVLAKSRGFDNHQPRAWLLQQTGRSARANAAQANSFEGLAFFIGAVVIAHQLGAAQAWVDGLALAYVLLRCVFIACYLRDWASARSMVWGLGLLANIGILLTGWHGWR